MFKISESSATTLEDLLVENEYIKENYRSCSLLVLDSDGEERYGLRNHDILLTDNRIILIKDAEYSSQTSKIPTRFSCGGYINISAIVVNAVSSCEKEEDVPYLYIQLADNDITRESGEDSEQSDHFSEVNIRCSDQNTVYTLFNSISETAAYLEQLSDLSDSQTDEELALDQD